MIIFLLLILSFLSGCSGLKKSEEKKVRERNLTLRPIERLSDEILFPPLTHPPKKKEPYPWEQKKVGSYLRITKEFFRCRGNRLNPPIQIPRHSDVIYHLDCGGIETHSLPIKNGKEFIYPILIELLNYIQEKTDKKVIITCGHRCPIHNLYADPSKKEQSSKHLIGAEVDFYVEGFEYAPQEVIRLLLSYYDEPLQHPNTFKWINKEIALTLVRETEGRDCDNLHPYPYITLQVLYDKTKSRPVKYNWHQAHNGYIKH